MASKTDADRAPWDAAPAHEQLFVLITGANSGIGLGIGERLIDEFLATRSLTSHLILVPTTRSVSKSTQTIQHLRAHANKAARISKALVSRAGGPEKYNWEDTASRVHILSPQLDLCDIKGIYAFAERLCDEPLSNPAGLQGQDAELQNVRIPRLDSVICNAAYGSWVGVNYPMAIWVIMTEGLINSVTWPTFKIPKPTALLNGRPIYNYPAKPKLGEVFCACVFGHYLLSRKLLPLLTRPKTSESLAPGRIIWSSSIEAHRDVFNPDDIQGLLREHPYESAKRLTDYISLSYNLPAVEDFKESFLSLDEDENPDEKIQPEMYLTHPGIVANDFFPVPWYLMWAYRLAIVVSRWLGSPWHTIDSYTGARSAAWLALQGQEELDDAEADRVKWGSASGGRLQALIKKTEVEGWGWTGRVEGPDADAAEEGIVGVLRRSVGRRRDAADPTAESLAEFEEVGADVWEQLEELREEWEEILEIS
ncbi:unnamed protein product [Clonostachys rosea f. rosea IK726]|uniref:Uncharacterized protein n=1 Tax=Clonostachys rosea f. rosea IK726 TaxID=1349383 RepID=A0ACA9TSL1_BIOOC|nr:unnamed protein product [Clonostachys rosea f. rosea IK726]